TTSLRAISALEKSITTIASTWRSRGESGGRSRSSRTARGTTHWPADTARSVGNSVRRNSRASAAPSTSAFTARAPRTDGSSASSATISPGWCSRSSSSAATSSRVARVQPTTPMTSDVSPSCTETLSPSTLRARGHTSASSESSVSVGTGSAIGRAGIVGGDLDQASIQQVAAERHEVVLHDRRVLVVLRGHLLGGRADIGGLAQYFQHVPAHRVQAVVLTGLEVEDDRFGHEAAMHHMFRQTQAGAQQAVTVDHHGYELNVFLMRWPPPTVCFPAHTSSQTLSFF